MHAQDMEAEELDAQLLEPSAPVAAPSRPTAVRPQPAAALPAQQVCGLFCRPAQADMHVSGANAKMHACAQRCHGAVLLASE